MRDSELPPNDPVHDPPTHRGASLDPASLDRLCDQTHRLVDGCDESILRVYYWATFLEIYLESGIRAPVYEEDGLSGLIEALSREDLDRCDPLLPNHLRKLADAASLGGNALLGTFRAAIEQHERRATSLPALLARPGDDLRTGVILVMQARPLWRRPPVLGIPETLSVRASRGFVAPGQISWHGRLVPGDAIHRTTHDALAAALHSQGFVRARLSYEVRIGRPQLPLMGSSLGLALASLVAAFEAAAHGKALPVPRPDTVLCGAVESNGTVLPVSPKSLRQKLRATAGAGFRSFVLPAENADDAANELADLAMALPGLSLPRLIPIRQLRDIWTDPQIVHMPTPSVRSRVRRRRTFPVALAIILAVLATFGALYLRPRWTTPEKITATYLDTPRRTVATRVTDFPPREKIWKFDTIIGDMLVADLYPISPAVLLVGTAIDGPTPARLFCYDIPSRRLFWSRNFTRPAPLSDRFYADNSIMITRIAVGDIDGNGKKDIILTLHANPSSPCFVLWLLADGTQMAIYAHRGYLMETKVVDLRKTGRPMVLLTGTSNTNDKPFSQSGTLVALDTNHFTGWPQGGSFEGAGIAPFDSALARVVFPPIPEHCEITDAPGYMVKYFVVSPSATDPRIIVAVAPHWNEPGLVITLDGEFRPIQVLPEDGLAPLVDRAIKTGRIQSDFTTPERLRQYALDIRRAK